MHTILKNIGQYFIMLRRVFSLPEKRVIFLKQIILEIEKIGLNSLGIVIVIVSSSSTSCSSAPCSSLVCSYC